MLNKSVADPLCNFECIALVTMQYNSQNPDLMMETEDGHGTFSLVKSMLAVIGFIQPLKKYLINLSIPKAFTWRRPTPALKFYRLVMITIAFIITSLL